MKASQVFANAKTKVHQNKSRTESASFAVIELEEIVFEVTHFIDRKCFRKREKQFQKLIVKLNISVLSSNDCRKS